MGGLARATLPEDLADGRSQFQACRARRTTGRIPQTLWTLAVRLASRHVVSRTATALGLDYYRLKKQARETADPAPASGPAFVELPSRAIVGKQAVVELRPGEAASVLASSPWASRGHAARRLPAATVWWPGVGHALQPGGACVWPATASPCCSSFRLSLA
jgi:hypothetical protein